MLQTATAVVSLYYNSALVGLGKFVLAKGFSPDISPPMWKAANCSDAEFYSGTGRVLLP